MVRRLLVAVLACAAAASTAATPATAAAGPATRVTVIGDSVVTGVLWNGKALAILGQGLDLKMQVAVCRRLTGQSCPYEGGEATNLVDLVSSLGAALGPTVVVVVGYNDYQQTFAASVEQSVRALLGAGVKRILWATLRVAREPYVTMNSDLWAAAVKHPELTIVDWNRYSRSHPDWFQNDGIHLVPAGAVALAGMLHAAVMKALAPSRLVVVDPRLPVARVGRPYASRLLARGGSPPYRWRVVAGSWPRGLHLRVDGRISGTPLRQGRVAVVLRAADAEGLSVTHRLVLVVRR